MPEFDSGIQEVIDLVGALRCEVELPSSYTDFFCRSGPMPTSLQEKRRYCRSYLRTKAALEYRQSFPALSRRQTWHAVYARDVSRSGVSFLHAEQLFPKEQMNLAFPNGSVRPIEVARCRRIQERCFEIGATFIGGFRGPDLADSASGQPDAS